MLDVTISSNLILDEILGIKDLRSDKRIDFVGGIRGLGELKNFGGVTGDLCGYFLQVCELVMALVVVVVDIVVKSGIIK